MKYIIIPRARLFIGTLFSSVTSLFDSKLAKVFLLSNFICLHAFAQIGDIVQTDGIKTLIHQNNIGKITFMDGVIPLEQYQEKDFLTSFELKKESNLNIRVFLENSITNYMHQLAPELSEEELNRKGNYQFAFWVDGKLIYKENIHYGCGLKKSTTTTFRVPFTDTAGGDWWSIYLFERFKSNGGNKALSVGTHQLRVEIRPYIKLDDQMEVKIGELIAAGQLNLIIKSQKIPSHQIAIQPISANSGFEISHAHYNKSKIKELNKCIAQNVFKEITSIVILKDGQLLLEEYFNNANRNMLHDTRSVGKSFTAAIMGLAIKDGYIKDEKQTLGTFYPLKKHANYDAYKDSITLMHLLTMSTAINGSDSNSESPGNEENMYPTADWVKFALDLPMDPHKKNGEQWDYFTAGVVLLGDILQQAVPEGLEKYAHKNLFIPLEIDNYQWQYTPKNVANTAGGLQMTSLSLAKFGQLYKNNGKWKEQQILPTAWVGKTLTKYFPIPDRENEFYGLLFWNKTYTINGKNYETYYCAGNGGSKIFIFPELPFTVVITAKAYNRPYGHQQVDKMMESYILPALLYPKKPRRP